MNDTQSATEDRSRKRRILCIESEPDMISLIKLILERDEFSVIGALGGQQGLTMARRLKPDAVLLDLILPDTDGWEVARQMRAEDELRDVPIIVVSVVTHNGHDSQELLIDDHIVKPFAPRELVRRVKKALSPRHTSEQSEGDQELKAADP